MCVIPKFMKMNIIISMLPISIFKIVVIAPFMILFNTYFIIIFILSPYSYLHSKKYKVKKTRKIVVKNYNFVEKKCFFF